jgi:hypothetical protein
MRKNGRIFFLGLLVLFVGLAGSAFADKPVSLNGTWTGNDITIVTAGNPGTVSTNNSFSISFTASSTDADLLYGPFTLTSGGTQTDFSAVRDGKHVSIVAEGFIIHARIETVVLNKTPTTIIHISGKDLTNGRQFKGNLTE